MRRLWGWAVLALGGAETRLGLGFELLRLRWDGECLDEWSRGLEAQARQARLDAELARLLEDGGGPV
ncbi:hypothetical protein ACFVIM_22210 [Streptomyces sp. NPDC057638]|uniref:hypothetical protein n=1 Tax=Streptomyces sp. NPDC057638 TaxID=3346190 RepID=UPI0036CE6E78